MSNSNRSYRVVGPWYNEATFGTFTTQTADLFSERDSRTFVNGAYRVVDSSFKPVSKVFKGETAWMSANSFASDLALKERYS